MHSGRIGNKLQTPSAEPRCRPDPPKQLGPLEVHIPDAPNTRPVSFGAAGPRGVPEQVELGPRARIGQSEPPTTPLAHQTNGSPTPQLSEGFSRQCPVAESARRFSDTNVLRLVANHFWPYFGELRRCVTAAHSVINTLANYPQCQRPRDRHAMDWSLVSRGDGGAAGSRGDRVGASGSRGSQWESRPGRRPTENHQDNRHCLEAPRLSTLWPRPSVQRIHSVRGIITEGNGTAISELRLLLVG